MLHILAVEREYQQLVKSGPIGKMYSSLSSLISMSIMHCGLQKNGEKEGGWAKKWKTVAKRWKTVAKKNKFIVDSWFKRH
jgi:hypothetical protein